MIIEAERKAKELDYSYSPRPEFVPVGDEDGSTGGSSSSGVSSGASSPSGQVVELSSGLSENEVLEAEGGYSPRSNFEGRA